MKLDTTAKIVTLVSVSVGIMISIAGYITGLKLHSLEERLKSLDEIGKVMDNSSKEYDKSPRLITEFQLPLARTFAEQYSNRASVANNRTFFLIPTSELMNEFGINIPKWKTRRELMTGHACAEGLKVRQVITLNVKNIGYPDAIDIRVKALQKVPGDAVNGWHEMTGTSFVPYYSLSTSSNGWKAVEFPLTELRGQSTPEPDRNEAQIVLASISGATTFYGTVLVPIEVIWTDKITKKAQTRRIMESEVPKLMSALLGAEIGTLGTACPERN